MLNIGAVMETVMLEEVRGVWNSASRGKIRRYAEEYQKRRQHTGAVLTLRDESVGSETD